MGQESAVLLGSLSVILAAVFAFYVLLVIALWKIFKKMGEPGWKAITPFYNIYIQFKHTWKTSYFWAYLILGFAAGVCASISGNGEGGILSTVGSLLSIISVVILCIDTYYLYKSFGHGIGWFIASIFVGNIMLLVLGFGSSRYLGNGSELK